MANCRICGKEIPEGQLFCSHCPRPIGWAGRVGMAKGTTRPEFTALELRVLQAAADGVLLVERQARELGISVQRAREVRSSILSKIRSVAGPVDSFYEVVLKALQWGWVKE